MIGNDIIVIDSSNLKSNKIKLRVMDIILVTERNDYKGGMANATAYLCRNQEDNGKVRVVNPRDILEIKLM